jgi:hypothetical protein
MIAQYPSLFIADDWVYDRLMIVACRASAIGCIILLRGARPNWCPSREIIARISHAAITGFMRKKNVALFSVIPYEPETQKIIEQVIAIQNGQQDVARIELPCPDIIIRAILHFGKWTRFTQHPLFMTSAIPVQLCARYIGKYRNEKAFVSLFRYAQHYGARCAFLVASTTLICAHERSYRYFARHVAKESREVLRIGFANHMIPDIARSPIRAEIYAQIFAKYARMFPEIDEEYASFADAARSGEFIELYRCIMHARRMPDTICTPVVIHFENTEHALRQIAQIYEMNCLSRNLPYDFDVRAALRIANPSAQELSALPLVLRDA